MSEVFWTKYREMTLSMLKNALVTAGLGLLAFFAVLDLLPYLWHNQLMPESWPWACGLIGWACGGMLTQTFMPLGFQLGITRKTMLWAHGSALAGLGVVLASGALAIESAFAAFTSTASRFDGQSLGLLWVYILLLVVCFGGIGMLCQALTTVPTTKLGKLGMIGVLFVIYMVALIAIAVVIALLTSFLPRVQAAYTYVLHHQWTTDLALFAITAGVWVLVSFCYRRFNVPQGGR